MKKTIFLVGYMGSGKTTIGKAVAARLGVPFYDLDIFIESKFCKSISDIFAEFGEEKFRQIERNALLQLIDFEQCVISTGGGTPCFFDNMDLMNSASTTIFLECPPKILAERLDYKNNKRPLLKGKSRAELELFILETLEKRLPFYQKATHTIPSDDTENAIEEILLIV